MQRLAVDCVSELNLRNMRISLWRLGQGSQEAQLPCQHLPCCCWVFALIRNVLGVPWPLALAQEHTHGEPEHCKGFRSAVKRLLTDLTARQSQKVRRCVAIALVGESSAEKQSHWDVKRTLNPLSTCSRPTSPP